MMVPPSPRDLGLTRDEWRQYQDDAVGFLIDRTKYARILEAPTGSGKTLLKLAASLLLGGKAYSLTPTKQLQDQDVADYPPIHIMKGQSSYECLIDPVTVEEGPCHAGWNCPSRRTCPYYVAKAKVNASDTNLVSMNYNVYLTDRKYRADFGTPSTLCMDEAHNAERILADAITIDIRDKSCHELDLDEPPRELTKAQKWAWTNGKTVARLLDDLLDEEADLKDQDLSIPPDFAKRLKAVKAMDRKLTDLKTLTDPDNWVVEDTNGGLLLRPIFVREHSRLLLGGTNNLLFTSATLADADYFADCLGLSSYAVKRLPSTFPVSSRPVIVDTISTPMNYENEQDGAVLHEMVRKIDELISRHPGEKGLVHTVSYPRAEYIRRNTQHTSRVLVPSPEQKGYLLTPDSSGTTPWERDPRPLVLVSPSMGEGVNLPHAQCRFQIIPKVPFPSLGSPWVQARKNADPKYYPNATALAVTQMVGRAMRDQTDWGVSYIIDPAIRRVLDESSRFFSPHFLESVRYEIGKPKRKVVRAKGVRQ